MTQARILVVEDLLTTQQIYRAILERAGYLVSTANDYEQAIALVDSSIDLALVDISLLGGKSGIEVLKFIRQHQPNCPVIMVSAFANKQNAIDSLREGAADYLEKPVEPDELPLVVQRWLSYRSLQKENVRLQDYQSMYDALQQSEAKFRSIFEASPVPLALNDKQGNFVYINKAFIQVTGYLPDDIPTLDAWGRRAYPDWQYRQKVVAAWQANMEKAQRSGSAFVPIEQEIRCKDGSTHIFSVSAAPLQQSYAGNYLFVLYDITERKAAENQLLELNEQLEERIEQRTFALTESMRKLEEKELSKSRFFAAAGHDLRQPLAAANLFIDALKSTDPTPRQNTIIKQLVLSMATFNGLLDALLNISKLDSGVIKPEFAPIKVAEVFNWLDHNFAPLANEKQLGFKLYFPLNESLVALGDIGLLNSVLMNLVSNAIKFTHQGAVLISARKRGSEVLFQVWDTGMGIAEENLEHIFEEFYQVNNPKRNRVSGLGLGLAIANRAAMLCGYRIGCRSRVGRGSVFGFSLPLDVQSSGVVQHGAIGNSPGDHANLAFVQGKRFIVLEDDVLVAQALIHSLEGLGGEVQCYHGAEEALHHANTGSADCYIVDYMLGGSLNGIQFLNLLHQKRGKHINAVVMTGDTSSTFMREARNLDWPVLHKPVNTAMLISRLSAQAV